MLTWIYNGFQKFARIYMFEAKYLEIANKLEARINSCHWKGRLPGVAVLSKEFGANSRTVSKALKVLSDKGKITIKPSSGSFICPEKTERTYGVIGVLGLIRRNQRQLGLDNIEEVAKSYNYYVLSVEHCNEIFKAKPGLLLKIPVDGLIFSNSLLTPEIVKHLNQADIPFVSTNRISEIPGINWVDFDHIKAQKNILEHLLSLGHRRIALVSYHPTIEEHARRMKNVFRETLEPLGLYDPVLYIDDGDMMDYYRRYGEHYSTMYGMEKGSYLMSHKHRPTAAVVYGYDMAHGFCHQAQKMGLKVPEDISVIGISQNQQEAERESFLTLIVGDVCKRSARAAEILLKVIESPHGEPVQELIGMDLLPRKSVCACKIQEQ